MSFRKPWERRDDGDAPSPSDRPPRRGGGFRKPWERRDGADAPSFSDRPPRREGGFRKPWERRDDADAPSRGEGPDGRPPFRSDRPRPFRPARDAEGFRGAFRRKPWERREDGDGPSFSDRPPRREGGFRKPWERREGGDGPSFSDRPPRREGGFRKPWERREGGDGEGDGGFRKPWAPRKPRTAPIPAEGELIFGRQPVREMLRAGRRAVNLVVLSDGVKDSDEVLEIKRLCEERSTKIEFHSHDDLEAWVNGANHQGVVAFAAEYPYADLDEIADALSAAEGNATVVVLDHVQDPQNLGSILRTCECAGVVGVVLAVDRAVGVTPAAVRASAGAAEHLRIARVSNLVVALERFKGAGAWITGLEAVPSAKPYAKVDFKGKSCLVIGSEAHGLCSPVRRKCDFLARLPMRGRVNSLNAGVAAAIALYEMLRQQGANDDEANFPAVEEPVEAETAEPDPAAVEDASAEPSVENADDNAGSAPSDVPDAADDAVAPGEEASGTVSFDALADEAEALSAPAEGPATDGDSTES